MSVRRAVSTAGGHGRGGTAPILATSVAVLMGGVVPLAIGAMPVRPDLADVNLILLAVAITASLRYAWLIGSVTRHLFEMVFWLFVYFFLGIAPLVQIRTAWPGTTPDPNLALLLPAALASLIGAAGVAVGSSLYAARARSRPASTEAARGVDERRVLALALGSLAAAVVYVQAIGVSQLFRSRMELAGTINAALGDGPSVTILRAAAVMGLTVSFVALMHVRRQRRARGANWPRALSAVVLAALVLVSNPISSSRYGFGTVALAILASFGAYATVRRFRAVALGAVAGVVILFPALDAFRYTLDADVEFSTPLESLTTGDFDAFAQLVNTFERVRAFGLSVGRQLLGVLLFWVPRDVWPDKPVDTGILLAEAKGYGFTNLSAPIWSELYINFGWLGIVGGSLALGATLRRLDRQSEMHLRSSPIPPVLGAVLPFYMLIIYRGSLLQATANLAVLLVAAWFVSSRPGSREASGPQVSRRRPAPVPTRSARRRS